MTPPDSREASIIRQARELEPAAGAAFLDRLCAGDPALRQRLEVMLAEHERSEKLLSATQPDTVRATRQEVFAEDRPDEGLSRTLGRYKLLQRVGEGGCGVVYVAEQTEPVRRRVALKVIKLTSSRGQKTRS